MNLREYMFVKRIKLADMAKKVGCSKTYISLIRNGRTPSYAIAKKISGYTGGFVTIDEIMNPQDYLEEE